MSDDYEVGYGKPPKHSQFPPGVSGNKGRRKRAETAGEIVARVRDETVEWDGRRVTKLELMIRAVFAQTMQSRRTRDMAQFLAILDKYGALPPEPPDDGAKAKAAANAVIDKIVDVFCKQRDLDPDKVAEKRRLLAERDRLEAEEALLVMRCHHCGPTLKARWKSAAYKMLAKSIGKTALHARTEAALVQRRDD